MTNKIVFLDREYQCLGYHKSEIQLNVIKVIYIYQILLKLLKLLKYCKIIFFQIASINVWASGRRTGCCTLTLGGEICRRSNASSVVQVKIMQVMFRQK
jgi:hypothetical protein